MRRLLRAHLLAIRAFGIVQTPLNWAFFIVGVAGAIGTLAGLLPPFSGSWWAKITSVLLWLVLAQQGYQPLAEAGEKRSRR